MGEPIPESVTAFRASYRAGMPRTYNGWAHFAFTSLGALTAIGFCLSRLRAVRPAEWLVVPVAFLVANFAEYLGHRGPMHHLRPGLGLLFQRHTQQHHRFYTSEAMAAESHRDFHMVLFPPVMLLFFLGALATPIGALFYVLVSPNAGFLFAAVGVGYFLTYEWLHWSYHQEPGSIVGRLPGIAALRRHHLLHHDLALMGKWNFNITFPIADLAFGTIYRGASTPSAEPSAPAGPH